MTFSCSRSTGRAQSRKNRQGLRSAGVEGADERRRCPRAGLHSREEAEELDRVGARQPGPVARHFVQGECMPDFSQKRKKDSPPSKSSVSNNSNNSSINFLGNLCDTSHENDTADLIALKKVLELNSFVIFILTYSY